jgi:hypothetical protein
MRSTSCFIYQEWREHLSRRTPFDDNQAKFMDQVSTMKEKNETMSNEQRKGRCRASLQQVSLQQDGVICFVVVEQVVSTESRPGPCGERSFDNRGLQIRLPTLFGKPKIFGRRYGGRGVRCAQVLVHHSESLPSLPRPG